MKSISTLPRRWMGFAIVIVVFVRLPAVVGRESPGSGKSKPDARRAAELVDAIVNHNKAPKLVKWQGDLTEKAALFPEDHDWKEEARVRKAIYDLAQDQTEEVWEELVKRTG